MQHNKMRQVLVDFFLQCDQWAIWHWHWNMEHGQDGEGQGMKYLDPETQPHERKWSPSRPRSTPRSRSDNNKVKVFCGVKLLFQVAQDCKLRLIFNSTDGDGLFHQSSSARNELLATEQNIVLQTNCASNRFSTSYSALSLRIYGFEEKFCKFCGFLLLIFFFMNR